MLLPVAPEGLPREHARCYQCMPVVSPTHSSLLWTVTGTQAVCFYTHFKQASTVLAWMSPWVHVHTYGHAQEKSTFSVRPGTCSLVLVLSRGGYRANPWHALAWTDGLSTLAVTAHEQFMCYMQSLSHTLEDAQPVATATSRHAMHTVPQP
jgi:hypothetical protein